MVIFESTTNTVTFAGSPVYKVVFAGFVGAPQSTDGGGSVPVDSILPVNFNGQTQLNVFQLPTSKTELIINHALYQEDEDYTFGTNGGNTVLIWGGEFPLSTTDEIIFRKY